MQTTTIYLAAEKRNKVFSQKEFAKIGMQASALYEQITGAKPEKITQLEKCADKQFRELKVNTYPIEFEPVLFNLIDAAS